MMAFCTAIKYAKYMTKNVFKKKQREIGKINCV